MKYSNGYKFRDKNIKKLNMYLLVSAVILFGIAYEECLQDVRMQCELSVTESHWIGAACAHLMRAIRTLGACCTAISYNAY
jgi:hypothetical protein